MQPYLSGDLFGLCQLQNTWHLGNGFGVIPKGLDALMFLSRQQKAESVSVLKRLCPSNAISSMRALMSYGKVVPHSHVNCLRATAVLNVRADNFKTCLADDISCFVASRPSDCSAGD